MGNVTDCLRNNLYCFVCAINRFGEKKTGATLVWVIPDLLPWQLGCMRLMLLGAMLLLFTATLPHNILRNDHRFSLEKTSQAKSA